MREYQNLYSIAQTLIKGVASFITLDPNVYGLNKDIEFIKDCNIVHCLIYS